MDGLTHDSVEMGRFLLHECLSLTPRGCLSKVIRACRPNWPEECVWSAADALLEQGMRPRGDGESRQDFIVYVEKQLSRFAAEHAPQAPLPQADEQELKAWRERWERCRSRVKQAS